MTLPQKFWEKVNKNGQVPDSCPALGACWIWNGATSRTGYGYWAVKRVKKLIHRLTYVDSKGEIPAGLEIDHLCKNRGCCNPHHLEAVTHKENLARSYLSFKERGARGNTVRKQRCAARTHCRNGHEFTTTNTYITKEGHRECRKCRAISQRAYEKNKRGKYGVL